MEIIVSVRTSVGGRTSSNASAWASSAYDDERADETRAQTLEEREHRARELGAALHVEDAERLTDFPVRNPLVVRVGAGARTASCAPRRCPPGRHRRGASAEGRFGSSRRIDRTSSLAAAASVSAARSSSPRSRLCAANRSAVWSSPPRRASATCLDRSFICALRSSRRPDAERARCVELEQAVDGFGRHAAPSESRRDLSGCSRTSRISITVPPKVA